MIPVVNSCRADAAPRQPRGASSDEWASSSDWGSDSAWAGAARGGDDTWGGAEQPGSDAWVTPRQVTALPGTDPVSQTVEWRLDLAPSEAALQPGQTVRVRFEDVAAASPAAGGLRLPRAAVLRRGELTAVYVARDQHFVLQAVRTGPLSGDSVEVVAGLRSGQQVAADALAAGLTGATPAR